MLIHHQVVVVRKFGRVEHCAKLFGRVLRKLCRYLCRILRRILSGEYVFHVLRYFFVTHFGDIRRKRFFIKLHLLLQCLRKRLFHIRSFESLHLSVYECLRVRICGNGFYADVDKRFFGIVQTVQILFDGSDFFIGRDLLVGRERQIRQNVRILVFELLFYYIRIVRLFYNIVCQF